MLMRLRSKTPMTSSALRFAMVLLALFFIVSVAASAAIPTSPDHFTSQSAVDVGFPDCSPGELASGQTHCQSPTYVAVETFVLSSLFVPTFGSSAWFDAAVRDNSTPAHLRLFRPPKYFRAQV